MRNDAGRYDGPGAARIVAFVQPIESVQLIESIKSVEQVINIEPKQPVQR
jgi:hypothetical protein